MVTSKNLFFDSAQKSKIFDIKETLVFLDEGFIYKLIKYLGKGKPIKFNRVAFAKNFVPVIENLEQQEVKTILYTYFEKKRDTNFSRGNELIKSVHKYILLNKEDFENAPLNKSENKK